MSPTAKEGVAEAAMAGPDLKETVRAAVVDAVRTSKTDDRATAFWLKVLASVASAGLAAAVGLAFSSNERLTRVEEGLARVEKLIEAGILPVAAVKFERVEARLDEYERRITALEAIK